MIYSERNPVRAGSIGRAWEYAWSSAHAHVGGSDAVGLLDIPAWRARLAGGLDWRETLSLPQAQAVETRLRNWSYRGCPLGSDSFISKIEAALNLRLRPPLAAGHGSRQKKNRKMVTVPINVPIRQEAKNRGETPL